ncbi:uncharacterized protein PG998_011353 [Apiospora kogelbergensis]|uniref:uncharacterized protein n=1 Tax=Apiospora kogelbergensis TaxID=1337665 RepID=UPI00312F7E2E
MHHALLLPEIVAAIIKSDSSEPGYLHTCLLVNRLFSEEARRLLWYGCGSRYNSATAGHVTPGIRQLAEISQHSRQRAQIYANFVNILNFAEPRESWPYGDEAQWHHDLACLQYPQLQEVSFFPSKEAASLNKGDVVVRYAQPSLCHFELFAGSELSDAFLDELRTNCPKLQHLELSSSGYNTTTPDALLRFLTTFDSLTSLTMQIEVAQDLWTREAFRVVGQYANLEFLNISLVHDAWIQGEETLFPAMKHLYTSISTSGLGLLSHHMPNLSTLHAKLLHPCNSMEALASYPRLKDLKVTLSEVTRFTGADLLLIAENCPELQSIEVGHDGPRPSAEGLDDSMMESIARNIPNIQEFKLQKVDTEALTLESIKSLGRHCPKLKDLSLSYVSIDWEDGDELISDSIWCLNLELHSELHTRLWPDDYDEDGDGEAPVSREQIIGMAEHFGRRFPSMEYFYLSGGGEGEEVFNEVLGDFIELRSCE